MMTTLVAGAAVPLWDRKLMRALAEAVRGLPPANVTIWQLGVMNDEGQVYRRIVAEGPTESLNIIGCFAKRHFRLAEHQRQSVVYRSFDSTPGATHLRRLIDASPIGPH